MLELPVWAAAIGGLGAGIVIGFTVRRARLCTFGAIEDALVGKDWRRMKTFGLALAIAILFSQAMVMAGWLDPIRTGYVAPRIAILSIVVGSVLFGLGMAYVGTCAFGSLIRAGGGDLRSLVVIVVFALTAYMALRGSLAYFRLDMLEHVWIAGPGKRNFSLPDFLGFWTGREARLIVTIITAGFLIVIAARDKRLYKMPRLLTAAIVLGLGVASGWFFTAAAIDPFADQQPRVQSLTFVAPTTRALFLLLEAKATFIDFGTMSVFGVILGAFAHAKVSDEFRWEAFDDQYEMRRHLIGGLLMGAGGVLAGGCTIGQGLSAGSMLSVTWPIAMAGMIIGARFGLILLLEGSITDWLRSRLPSSRNQK